MSYTKETFDGKYLTWYEKLKSQEKTEVFLLENYQPVGGKIESLKWEGEGKKSICEAISKIDTECTKYYESVSNFVAKTRIVYTILYPDLKLLKDKIDKHNACVDEYNKLSDLIEKAKAEEAAKAQAAAKSTDATSTDASGGE